MKWTAPTFRVECWRGGPAPSRIYIPGLLDDVLDGTINPGLVLDFETDLDGTPEAYAAMDERRAKYDSYGPRIVGSVVGPDAHRVTVRLVRDSAH